MAYKAFLNSEVLRVKFQSTVAMAGLSEFVSQRAHSLAMQLCGPLKLSFSPSINDNKTYLKEDS